jgi:hypothetical protein
MSEVYFPPLARVQRMGNHGAALLCRRLATTVAAVPSSEV